MAGRRKQPACRARGRQSPVGAALRPWHRRDQRRFRDAGNAAIEPGAAGLARHRADDERMETEGDHPLHRDVSHLPAVLERHAAAARAGPVQPAAGARSPVQARRRGHSRRPARGERAAEYRRCTGRAYSRPSRRASGTCRTAATSGRRAKERIDIGGASTRSGVGRLRIRAS